MYDGKHEEGFDQRKVVPLDSSVVYQSISERVDNDVPWAETEYYQWALESRDNDSYRFESPEDVEDHFEHLETLFQEIRNEGYKKQAELDEAPDIYPPEYEEIYVNIGRDGQFILDDGRHRLGFAQALGFDVIPIRIFVRHEEWQRLRDEVARKGRAALADRDGLTVDHPDLRDILP
jgi:hypothetical protein